ncbi:hypothetical protein Tco_0595962 [Tanacetum coccineum]
MQKDVRNLVASPFTARIRDYNMPDGLKVPTNLKTYDEMSNPDDHLTVFMGTMDMHKLPETTWCRFFHITLSVAIRRFQKTQAEILGIRKRSDESLRDYLGRFGKETLHMTNRSDAMMTEAFISRLRPGRPTFTPLIKSPTEIHAPFEGNPFYDRRYRCLHPPIEGIAHGTLDNETKASLRLPTSSLVGFSGQVLWPLRVITAPFTFSDYIGKGSKTITMDFMIVRAPSPYNVILGQPGMR